MTPLKHFVLATMLLLTTSLFFSEKPSGEQPTPLVTDEFCHAAHAHTAYLAQNPAVKQVNDAFEKAYIQKIQTQPESIMDYTLPVVVHIVHDNGAENIPDAMVLQGVQHLNDAFANVGYYNQNTGVNTQIQFCLAKQDPDGNATTGINRVQSSLTEFNYNIDDLTVKDLIRWDPYHYINIWLVREICSNNGCGVAGYAYFPSAHGSDVDGIMMEAEWFGATNGTSGVQVHEMGHYLGLYHTFQNGCQNNDCLTDGDRVCDTPPDQSTAPVPCSGTANSCMTDVNSGFATDQNDMFINYMDYGDWDCYSAFTQGQTDRMHFSIDNIRHSLLDSKACNDPCMANISAGFTPGDSQINVGQTLNFNNTTTGGTTYQWLIDGVVFSGAMNASYTFNTEGIYGIVLQAMNNDPNCFDSDTAVIEVLCPVGANFSDVAQTVFVGEQINIINQSNNANAYGWLVNGMQEAVTADFSFVPDSAGVYELCLEAENGICSDLHCVYFIAKDPNDCSNSYFETLGEAGVTEAGQLIIPSGDGNLYFAGSRNDLLLLGKLTLSGQLLWAKELDIFPSFAGECLIDDIMIASDGNIVGTGVFHNGGVNRRGYYFKYDPSSHVLIWAKGNSVPSEFSMAHIFERTSDYLLVGTLVGCADPSYMRVNKNTGNILSVNTYSFGNCSSFQRSLLMGDTLIVSGRYNNSGGGTNRMRSAITLFDLNTGAEYWTRLYLVNAVNQTARMYTMDIELENETIYVLVRGDDDGTSATDVENYLYKTDMSGNIQWARKYNLTGGNNEQAREMVSVSDGFIFTGYFNNNTSGSDDIYIIKTDKDGMIQWSKVYDSEGNDRVSNNCLIPDNDGVLLIGKSDEDILLMRIHANGSVDSDNCTFVNDLMVTESTMLNPYDGQFNMTAGNHPLSVMSGNATPVDVDLPANVLCSTPCAEICDNGLDDDGDGYVDCFDEDCACDSVCLDFYFADCDTTDCTYTIIDTSLVLKELWSSDNDEFCTYSLPATGDLDKDGIPEIAVFKFKESNNAIHILNGVTGATEVVLDVNTLGDGRMSSIAIGDLDVNDNGYGEVIYARRDDHVFCFNHDGTLNWQTPVAINLPASAIYAPFINIADFNGDGFPEVYALSTIINGQTGTIMGVGSGSKGFSKSPPTVGLSLAADVLPDEHCPNCAGLELVAGNTVYAVDINTINNTAVLTEEVILNSQNDGRTSMADWDNDGDLDGVIVQRVNQSVARFYVWDLQTPTLLGQTDINNSGSETGVANVSDIDGDGKVEAVFTGSELLIAIDNDFSILWTKTTGDASGATGITTFDFNGDGKYELVYRDENNLQILNGSNGNVITMVPCWSPTGLEYPVTVDANADGQTEILIVCGNVPYPGGGGSDPHFRGRLRAYGSGSGPWMPSRQVWNQYSYFNTNINDDLSIPIQQQNPHIVGDSTVMNNFLVQYSDPDFPVPDLALDIAIDTTCPRDTTPGIPATYFTITICNIGDAVAPADIPIQIYTGNPTTGNVTSYFNTTTTQIIPIDSCITETILVPIDIGNYYMVVNDNASLLTPYDLENDFPVTPVAECNFLNNIDSFIVAGEEADLDLGPDTLMCDNGTVTFNAGSGFFYYNWQDGSSDSVFTAYGAGVYHVTVSNGCVTLTDTVTVEVDSTTVLDLGPDIGVCGDDTSVMITLSGFTSYQWFPSDYLDCDTCATVIASPPGVQTYIVVANNENGCYSVDTITIAHGQEYNDTLQFAICPEDTLWVDTVPLVAGDNMQIHHLSVLGCDSIVAYQVSGLHDSIPKSSIDTSACLGTSVNIGGFVIPAGLTQVLQFISFEGCDSLVTVTVAALDTFNTKDTIEICPGDTATIFGQSQTQAGNYTMTFATPEGCDSVHTTTLIVLPAPITNESVTICDGDSALIFGQYQSQAGQYSAQYTAANGCDSTHIVTLNVIPPIQIGMNIEPSCPNDSTGSINLNISGGQAPYTYAWGHSGIDSNEVFDLPAGDYGVTITDAEGCSAEAIITVDAIMPPVWTASTQDANCAGVADGAIVIFATTSGLTYSLDGITFQSDTIFSNLTAGEYDVFAEDAFGCIHMQTVIISEPFDWNVFLPAQYTIQWGESAQIEGQTNAPAGSMLQWIPTSDLSCDTCINPHASPVVTTDYTLVVTDPTGCVDSATVRVHVEIICEPDRLGIPNVFTPNFDGHNDYFGIAKENGPETITRFRIYDRWGELVFEDVGRDAKWDGRFKGKDMPAGVYVYIIEYVCADDSEGRAVGDVTLVR